MPKNSVGSVERIGDMDILQYFDINNIEHLLAFSRLNKEGKWPDGFIPEDTTFENVGWHMLLESKMAGAYIKLKLK